MLTTPRAHTHTTWEPRDKKGREKNGGDIIDEMETLKTVVMQWAERIRGKSWSNTESSNYRWMMSEVLVWKGKKGIDRS